MGCGSGSVASCRASAGSAIGSQRRSGPRRIDGRVERCDRNDAKRHETRDEGADERQTPSRVGAEACRPRYPRMTRQTPIRRRWVSHRGRTTRRHPLRRNHGLSCRRHPRDFKPAPSPTDANPQDAPPAPPFAAGVHPPWRHGAGARTPRRQRPPWDALPRQPRPVVAREELAASTSARSERAGSDRAAVRRRRRRDCQRPDGWRAVLPARTAIRGAAARASETELAPRAWRARCRSPRRRSRTVERSDRLGAGALAARSRRMPSKYTSPIPISAPGIASSAVAMCVSCRPGMWKPLIDQSEQRRADERADERADDPAPEVVGQPDREVP